MRNTFMILFLVMIVSQKSRAEGDTIQLKLVIENGRFEPGEFKVPAGKRVEIYVENKGPGAEEFESKDLKREKVVPQGQTVKVTLGTLNKGTYKIFGDYHSDTAKGKIVVE